MPPGKLFYAFEHDVFPLCHCKLKESHRHKLGGFWPACCELAHVRRAFHRRLLAEVELPPRNTPRDSITRSANETATMTAFQKMKQTQGGSESGGHRVSRKSEQ